MTTLYLGVDEIPYAPPGAREPPKRKRKGGARPARRRSKQDDVRAFLGLPKSAMPTTGDVATFLEAKYHIIEIFFEQNAQRIADAAADSYAGAIESLVMGAPVSLDPFGTVAGKIKQWFTEFLVNEELAKLGVPGVPTAAARKGVSHRKKHATAKSNAPRPSFIDTGLYEAAFRAWVGG